MLLCYAHNTFPSLTSLSSFLKKNVIVDVGAFVMLHAGQRGVCVLKQVHNKRYHLTFACKDAQVQLRLTGILMF